jgi:hypothetical protein
MIKKQIDIAKNDKSWEHTFDVVLIITAALGAIIVLIHTVFFG